MLSAAMMARYGLDMSREATAIEAAVDAVLARGLRTPDLAREPEAGVGTEEMTAAVLSEVGH